MKIFSKILFLGILLSSSFISVKAQAVDYNYNIFKFGRLTDLKDVAVAYGNNVYAFVGTKNEGSEVWVEIYDKISFSRNLLAEKCISSMIYTPGLPGSEDYIFKTQSNWYLREVIRRGGELTPTFDITSPYRAYINSDIKIIYNEHTQSFMAIWTQVHARYGQQVVGMIFRLTSGGDSRIYRISSLDEPFVLNIVDNFCWSAGIYYIPSSETVITHKDIDVTNNSEYAIVSIMQNDQCPIVRLVPMGLNSGERVYHYNFNHHDLFTTNVDIFAHSDDAAGSIGRLPGMTYKGISATMRGTPYGAYVYILLTQHMDTGYGLPYDQIVVLETGADFGEYDDYREFYLNIEDPGIEISTIDPPVIRINPVTGQPIILCTRHNTFDVSPESPWKYQVKAMSVNSAGDENTLAEVRSYDNNINEFDPIISVNQDYLQFIYRRKYAINLDRRTQNFDYIFGKNIPLTGTSRMPASFLISTGSPMRREIRGIVNLPDRGNYYCFWEEGAVNCANPNYLRWNPFNIYNAVPSYESSVSASFGYTPGTINFRWNFYPASRGERPIYTLYILKSDGTSNSPAPVYTASNQACWQNTGPAKDIAVILSVTGVSTPYLSSPLVFRVGSTP